MGANSKQKNGNGMRNKKGGGDDYWGDVDFTLQKSLGARHHERRGREKTKKQQRKNEKLLRKAEFFASAGDVSRERRARVSAAQGASDIHFGSAGSPARKNAAWSFSSDDDLFVRQAGNRSGKKVSKQQAASLSNASGDAWVADAGCGSNRKGAHFGVDSRRQVAEYEDSNLALKRARSASPELKVVKLKIGRTEESFSLAEQREALEQFACSNLAAALAASKLEQAEAQTKPVEWFPEMEMHLNALDRQQQSKKAKKSLNESDAEDMMRNRNNHGSMTARLSNALKKEGHGHGMQVQEPERRNSATAAEAKKGKGKEKMTLTEYAKAQAEKRALRCNFLDYAFIFDRGCHAAALPLTPSTSCASTGAEHQPFIGPMPLDKTPFVGPMPCTSAFGDNARFALLKAIRSSPLAICDTPTSGDTTKMHAFDEGDATTPAGRTTSSPSHVDDIVIDDDADWEEFVHVDDLFEEAKDGEDFIVV